MNNHLVRDVAIETLPGMRVACYQAFSLGPEPDGIHFIDAWISRQKIAGPVRNFGFDIEVPLHLQQSGVRGYEVWRTVPTNVRPSEGVTIQDFNGGLYAVLTLSKPFSDPFKYIPAGWKDLHEWVISSDQYRSGNHQWLEEIIFHADGDDLKLYHPVALREGETNGTKISF